MLRLNTKLDNVLFGDMEIQSCVLPDKSVLGYTLAFGDFILSVSEYIGSLVNVFGVRLEKNGVVYERTVSKTTVSPSKRLFRCVDTEVGNTVLVQALHSYLNGTWLSGLAVDGDEWGTMSKSMKTLVLHLLLARNKHDFVIELFTVLSVEQKRELLLLCLSFTGRSSQTEVLSVATLEFVVKNDESEKSPFLMQSETAESVPIKEQFTCSCKSSDFIEKVEIEKVVEVERIVEVEKPFGNYHRRGTDAFYRSLIDVYNSTPLYRGKPSWKVMMERLLSDGYSDITQQFLSDTGYSLNTTNLRNWHSYATRNILKSEKFEKLTETVEFTESYTELKHNTREIVE